jgi:hypothetical protein
VDRTGAQKAACAPSILVIIVVISLAGNKLYRTYLACRDGLGSQLWALMALALVGNNDSPDI